MSIKLNDNIKINAGKPSESKYLNTLNQPYPAVANVLNELPLAVRHIGLTVLVESGSTNVEYWFNDGVADTDLIIKQTTSDGGSDGVTDGENIGFYQGYDGQQSLVLSTSMSIIDFYGLYASTYNNFYRDENGYIRIGIPDDGIGKRAYQKSTGHQASWIWSDYQISGELSGWTLIDGHADELIGQYATSTIYYATASDIYTETGWTTSISNGSNVFVSSVIGDLNSGNEITIGGPIFNDVDDNVMRFRTIKSLTSGLNISFDDAFIYLSGTTVDLSASNTGTTGTNTAGVYYGVSNNNLLFRRLVGSGGTTINETGTDIIVYSNQGGSGDVFTEDLLVSISPEKTFGKYLNGDTIPAIGKTAKEIIEQAIVEALTPTANLGSSSNVITFGEENKIVNLNFSYVINSLNASVQTTELQYRRNNTGSWTTIMNSTGSTTYTHNIDDSSDRFNTDTLNYRYIVTDSVGGTITVTHNVTLQSYSAPTLSLSVNGSISSPETQTSREKGNVDSNISGTITVNRPLVNITGYTVERDIDGGGYVSIHDVSGISSTSITIPSISDSGTISNTATSIKYRIRYYDEYTNGTGGLVTITFKYFSYWGYNVNSVLNGTEIKALDYSAFKSSQALTTELTAGTLEYTFYSYPSVSGYNSLTEIKLPSGADLFGAFTKLSDVNVTNDFGVVTGYNVYKSNSPGAFTNQVVIFE